MIAAWQLDPYDPAPYSFALITPGPDFRLWDWAAGAWETTVVPLAPSRHLKADEASIPAGLRTVVVPDEARATDLVGLAVVVYRFENPGWKAVQAIPIPTLPEPPDEPVVINNSGTVNIGGH